MMDELFTHLGDFALQMTRRGSMRLALLDGRGGGCSGGVGLRGVWNAEVQR